MREGISMPDDEYFASPAISKSLLSRMDCPMKSRMPFPSTPAMAEGSMIHCAVLEPDAFDSRYIVAPEINKRTNAGKAEWAAFCEDNADKEVITPVQYDAAMYAQKAVHAHPMASKLLSGGLAERAMFWKHEKTGEELKAKADYVSDILVDLKTTTCAAPGAFSKSCADFSYHVQAAHYMEGFEADEFVFVVLEKKTNVVECYRLDQEAIDRGLEQRDAWLNTYILCRDFDDWPGYNDPNGVTRLSLPAWSMRG